MYIVYMHRCRINNKCYIGLTTKSITERWLVHCRSARHRPKFHFHRAIAAYGEDAWDHEVLISGIASRDDAIRIEQEMILKYRTFEPELGYNMTIGGESPNEGRTLSDEHRRRIGDALRGRKHNDVSRLNMSEAHRGLTQSEETKAKRRESLCGHEVSEETRRKISEKRRGTKMSSEARRKMSESAKKRWKHATQNV